MPQHEKTVQPSRAEQQQTEPYQKTRDIAAAQLEKKVVDETQENPSVANLGNAGDTDTVEQVNEEEAGEEEESGEDEEEGETSQAKSPKSTKKKRRK